jgi:hypothetical protein
MGVAALVLNWVVCISWRELCQCQGFAAGYSVTKQSRYCGHHTNKGQPRNSAPTIVVTRQCRCHWQPALGLPRLNCGPPAGAQLSLNCRTVGLALMHSSAVMRATPRYGSVCVLDMSAADCRLHVLLPVSKFQADALIGCIL